MKKATINRLIKESKKYPDNIQIPLVTDALIKSLFIRNPDILGMFLRDVLKLKIKIKKITLKNVELPIDHVKEKSKNIDLFVSLNDKYLVDFEINSERFKDIIERNIAYAYKIRTISIEKGSDLENINKYKVYQLNLNTNTTKDEPLGDDGVCIGTMTNQILSTNPKIVIRNLAEYRNLYYNGDRRKDVVWLAMLTAKKYSELEEILSNVLDKKRIDEFIKEVKKMCFEDFIVEKWDEKKWADMIKNQEVEEALKKGKDEERNFLIENMFKNGLDISLIASVTKIPVRQLQEIQSKIL